MVERLVPAPPGRAWDLLVDLEAWPRWGPSIRRAELDGATELSLGVHGRVWTAVGVVAPFTVTEFDEGRSWAWQVAGIGATRHEVRAEPAGTTVAFGVPWWAPGYLPVCALALWRIERLLTGRGQPTR